MVINATFWVGVSFILFFAGLIYLKVPQKVNEILNNLIANIKNEIDESEKLRAEAKVLLDNSQIKLESAQNENKKIINEAKKESENVQNNVGILDLSTFAKYEIKGKDSETYLDRLCAKSIPKKEGNIILAHTLNKIGRIQSELTITRLASNNFYVLSSTASEIRDLDWFNHNLNKEETVNIKNVTKDYGVLDLAGPKSRKVLSQLTSQSLNNNDFPWLKGKEILINKIPVRALRVNYVGELGWELHHPMSQMELLYDSIYEAGKKENIINFGTYAVNSLRMEKAYRGWGAELTGEISLVEAGMDRFFNLKKKNNFFGAKALQN